MTAPFLEERLATSVRYGSSYGDDFNVEITETAGGQEYRRLVNPYPKRYFSIGFVLDTDAFGAQIIDLYQRAYGKYAGFRVKAADDFSTNGLTGAPTAFDQSLPPVATGIYQLQKAYGTGTPLSIGRPVRTIFKPVAGTTLVGISNPVTGNCSLPSNAWSIDTTTGLVTFSADKTASVTGITQAASAVLTVGTHTYVVGDSVYISGVVGMTQINGRRALVTATTGTTITVAINSSGFSAYSSGGAVNTRPQSAETVMGGCQFDIPCRFNTRLEIEYLDKGVRSAQGIELVELITL